MLRTLAAIVTSRLVRTAIRAFRPGGGSSVPGRVAAAIQPNLVLDAVGRLPLGTILVSGSAGKSSTTKFLVDILRGHGLRVFTNPSTSNIRQGFFSAVLTACDLRGRLHSDIAVIEVDEGHGPEIARGLRPRLVLFTNLLSDQLDRFVDPEVVLDKLKLIAQSAERIVINADDINLRLLAETFKGRAIAIGTKPELRALPTYPTYAFNDRSPTVRLAVDWTITGISASEVSISYGGDYRSIPLTSPGAHMALNMALAIAAADAVLEGDFKWDVVNETFHSPSGVFARWESVEIAGVVTRLALVQNPTSLALNLKLIGTLPERVFVGVGRDVHDPSWLWTVDTSILERIDVVAGFNAAEAAARLITSGSAIDAVVDEIPEAVDRFLQLSVSPGGERIMIITADAMRRLRRHLRLAK